MRVGSGMAASEARMVPGGESFALVKVGVGAGTAAERVDRKPAAMRELISFISFDDAGSCWRRE